MRCQCSIQPLTIASARLYRRYFVPTRAKLEGVSTCVVPVYRVDIHRLPLHTPNLTTFALPFVICPSLITLLCSFTNLPLVTINVATLLGLLSEAVPLFKLIITSTFNRTSVSIPQQDQKGRIYSIRCAGLQC